MIASLDDLMPDLRIKQFITQYLHGRYLRKKILRELNFANFAKFSGIRKKSFSEKSRILSNRENKFSQKIFMFFLYGFFKCIFSCFWDERTKKK